MTATEVAHKPLHRPYARLRGKPERSVTEIIKLKSIPGLPWGAAKETALFAVNHQDEWTDLETDDAVNRLRTHHKGIWDGRAAIGTATHFVLEAWFAGQTVNLFKLVCDLAGTEVTPQQDDEVDTEGKRIPYVKTDYAARTWVGHEAEATERLVGYVNGLERWWNDWQPSGGTSEDCVRTPGIYVGQRDRWGVTMKGGQTWGLDLKSTAQTDDDKGLYLDSWTLQLTAYDRAQELVDYAENDKGKVIELGTRPNERVDRHGIIHLRGDGDYALYPVDVTDEAYEAFLGLAHVGTWLRAIDKLDVTPASLS